MRAVAAATANKTGTEREDMKKVATLIRRTGEKKGGGTGHFLAGDVTAQIPAGARLFVFRHDKKGSLDAPTMTYM
jgi:hypothetical protein